MNLKNLFFLTIICWSLGIMACEPDPPTEPETLHPFTLENAAPAPDVEQAINDFEAYLDNPRPDFLEPMLVKNVVWSVEAKLNRTYTNVAHKFEQLHTQSDTIAIAHSGSMMSGIEVQAFYDEAVTKFSEHFYSLPVDNRLPVLVDVAENTGDSNTLILTTQVGTGTLEELSAGFDLHWFWGAFGTGGGGTCGPDASTVPPNVGRAANTELAFEANSRVLALNNTGLLTSCTAGPPIFCQIPWYTTNVEIVIPDVNEPDIFPFFYPNSNDDTPNDNNREYLIYFNNPEFDNFDDKACLSPSDMDFYYDGLIQVMEDRRPSGKDFILVNVEEEWGNFNQLPFNVFFYSHLPMFSYGEIITSPVTPYPTIEILPM